MGVWNLLIKLLFRKIQVPVEWIHETVDILDTDKSGTISLSELALTLRELWKRMRKSSRIARL